MPALTEIFGDDACLQFGGGTLGHPWGNAVCFCLIYLPNHFLKLYKKLLFCVGKNINIINQFFS